MNIDGQDLAVERIHEDALRNFGSNTGQRSEKELGLMIGHFGERCEAGSAEAVSEGCNNNDDLHCLESAKPTWKKDALNLSSVFREYGVPTWERPFEVSKRILKGRMPSSCGKNDVDQIVEGISGISVSWLPIGSPERITDSTDVAHGRGRNG